MESEIRFYYSKNKYNDIIEMMKKFSELNYEGCFFETTMQYDHPISEMSFYNKNVDGRFRVRVSKEVSTQQTKSKISWKKRTSQTFKGLINNEEEIELHFEYKELENLIFLLENVIKMKKVESYERYRNVFSNKDIEIVVDKYPFGVALELENKSKEKNPEDVILLWVKRLELNINQSYRLSWDDKYTELCREQNFEVQKNVTFDTPMPEVFDNNKQLDKNV